MGTGEERETRKMKEIDNADSVYDGSAGVECAACKGFRYFVNSKGHNTLQALGECRSHPWDGNKGQWPLLRHPCNSFVERETDPDTKRA